jgi:hypothetical protein
MCIRLYKKFLPVLGFRIMFRTHQTQTLEIKLSYLLLLHTLFLPRISLFTTTNNSNTSIGRLEKQKESIIQRQ